jgi:hypothetical protein
MLNIICGIAEVLGEVLVGMFDNNNENMSEIEKNTMEYWEGLSYQEQEEYFNNNEYLKDYINSHYYQNARHQTAKHVAELSYKLNREFTNKYDRY